MSPNEFQLRAALRDGEGDTVDPDRMIARAMAASRERRVRLGSIAAAAAIVAGIGVGGGLLLTGNHGTGSAASSAAGDRSQVAAGSAKSGALRSGTAAAAPQVPQAFADTTAAAIPCPIAPPRLLLPGGGGTGQFGGSGSMFSGPVAAAKVCGYPAGSAIRRGGSQVVSGRPAADLAASLDAAAKQHSAVRCPSPPTGVTPRLVIIAVSAAGQRMTPVVVTIACGGMSTNGTAVRYDWTPPAYLAHLAVTATPGDTMQPILPGGKVNGSPLH